jgi:hypothetical protein
MNRTWTRTKPYVPLPKPHVMNGATGVCRHCRERININMLRKNICPARN